MEDSNCGPGTIPEEGNSRPISVFMHKRFHYFMHTSIPNPIDSFQNHALFTATILNGSAIEIAEKITSIAVSLLQWLR